MRRCLMLLPVLAAMAACQQGNSSAAVAQPSSSVVASPAAGAAAGGAREVGVDNDLYSFHYSYPAAAGEAPKLRALLDADMEARRNELVAMAEEGRQDAQDNDYPYNPHGLWVAWAVVTDLPDWLSLSGDVSTYMGGAHPNHGFDAILWDKAAGVRRETGDLFTSEQALSAVLRKDFCRALDRERAQRRGEPVKPGSDYLFDECIDPVESTVILGSSNRKAFDRIGILVAPYAAGPYAEGSYEVTLPVTAAVLAVVKPEFRRHFAIGR